MLDRRAGMKGTPVGAPMVRPSGATASLKPSPAADGQARPSRTGQRISIILLLLAYGAIIAVIAQRLAMATSWTASLVLLGSVQVVLVIATLAGSRAQMACEQGRGARARRGRIPMASS